MLKTSITTFLAVCRSGSFTKAASVLFITPSAVMQQIDTLEKEYGVTLFTRTHQGVKTTEAGRYLQKAAAALDLNCQKIRRDLAVIARGNDTIRVGVSLLEKCRLLFDLWTMYSEKQPSGKIELINISTSAGIPDEVDLIESLNSGVPWMRSWDFFEICKVPMGIAMVNSHPLAKLKKLRLSDLHGCRLKMFTGTLDEGLAQIARQLEANGVPLEFREIPSLSVFGECVFKGELMLAPMCWNDILPGLTVYPVDWEYVLPYGIFSRPGPGRKTCEFLDFIRKLYEGSDPDDIVPTLL